VTDASRAGIRCGRCAEPLTADGPCPKCGSTSRTFTAQSSSPTEALLAAEAQATAPMEVIRSYPRELMQLARRLIDERKEHQFSLAVIVVYMACEIATERSISEALDAKGAQYLKDWVMDRRVSNLTDKRVRDLYTALTDNNPAQHSSWSEFKEYEKLRNAIVHRGRIATDAEAEASYRACNDLLEHLVRRMGREVASI
jgi:uncharacterized protein YijF (DUF1287 family)